MSAPSFELLEAIGGRLAERARRSVFAHRKYCTVRRDDRVWSQAGPGGQQSVLWQGPVSRITLFRLALGASLPWQEGVTAQEILVLQGRLCRRGSSIAENPGLPNCANISHIGAEPVLARWAYALRATAEAGRLTAIDAGTLVYVRQLLIDPEALPEPEARWWRLKRAPLQLVLQGTRRWHLGCPGVEVLPLWGNAAVTSMLVRFAAGAGVPDHTHALDEDCLMLEGEMFLGDTLLRPGDYQMAAAGSRHFGEMSDVGGTFYFHGAIDPVLLT